MTQATKLDGWKAFLKGRVAQEKGDLGAALGAFDIALSADPTNASFQKARAAVFTASGAADEAVEAIQREYGSLAKELTGDADTPDAWVKGLEGLLTKVERSDTESLRNAGGALMVAW